MLKLMYITNKPEIARIAEESGVDRIFVDMEFIGKAERQANFDSVKNRHTLCDVKNIKKAISNIELLVRVNPIHDKLDDYMSSEEEIDGVIKNGADIIMLPYFKTLTEVERFISIVDGRAKAMLLLETTDAIEILDDILKLKGIDEIHIGLNDLSICLKEKFMFMPFAIGIIDKVIQKIQKSNIPYGIGGIARLGHGEVPSDNIIVEHYRLKSAFAILSRSFCNANNYEDIKDIEILFNEEVRKIRELERKVALYTEEQFEQNRQETIEKIQKVVNRLQ